MRTIIILLLLALASSQTIIARSCSSYFAKDFDHKKRGSLERNNRSLENYMTIFGPEFEFYLKNLLPSANYLDVGAGYAAAAIYMSNFYKLNTIVINPTNLWKKLLQDQVDIRKATRIAGYAKIPLEGIKISRQERTYQYYKLPVFISSKIKQDIREQIQSYLLSSAFSYITGMAEEMLPIINEKFKLITDVFGGYFYSDQRLKILQEIYRKLEPQGRAYIALSDNSTGPGAQNDQVILRSSQKINFLEYIAQKYPDNFIYKDRYLTVIKNNRSINLDKLHIKSIQYNKTEVSKNNSFVYPIIIYSE